jgi:hypothetical protein
VTPPQDRPLTLWTAESYAALIALYLTNPEALDALLARETVSPAALSRRYT